MNQELSAASIWVLKKYSVLEKNLEKNLETYELAHSINNLYHFLWDDYANWYVEYLKTEPAQKPFAKELFRQFVVTLYPYSPFETEALWKEFFGEEKLLAFEIKDPNWTQNQLDDQKDLEISAEFEIIVNFISNLRSLRGLFAIDPVNLIQIFTSSETLLKYSQFIKLAGRTELINEENNNLYSVSTVFYNYSINILSYIKDLTKETEKTQKQILNLEKQIGSLEIQLQNPNFLENAEKVVVEEKNQDLNTRKLELAEQKSKLEFLSKIT